MDNSKNVYDLFIFDPIGYLRIQPIIGDGNCFFYAVSHQRFKNSSNTFIKNKAVNLRQLVVDFIELNLEDFEDWLDVNPIQRSDYLATIRINGRMVSSECIAAASRFLGRKIWIYQVNSPVLKFESNHNIDDSSPISLYYDNLHYESVVDFSTTIQPFRLRNDDNPSPTIVYDSIDTLGDSDKNIFQPSPAIVYDSIDSYDTLDDFAKNISQPSSLCFGDSVQDD